MTTYPTDNPTANKLVEDVNAYLFSTVKRVIMQRSVAQGDVDSARCVQGLPVHREDVSCHFGPCFEGEAMSGKEENRQCRKKPVHSSEIFRLRELFYFFF